MNILFSLHSKSNDTFTFTYNSLNLETTRLYLQKNNRQDKIKYENGILFYDNYILLDRVNKFELTSNNQYSTINICIDSQNKTCQVWNIKLI